MAENTWNFPCYTCNDWGSYDMAGGAGGPRGAHGMVWAIGPEVGKLLAPGRILYVKPGMGIDPDKDAGDRNWTFEVGFRYFF